MTKRYPDISRGLLHVSVVALLATLLALPLPTRAQSSLTDLVDLETFLDGIMAAHLESYHIPGATLSIVHDGEMLLAKGYGYADLETRAEFDPAATLFRPGSISKLFTCFAKAKSPALTSKLREKSMVAL
jgi:CubicO group peptidase (beta-lactamase class C family)